MLHGGVNAAQHLMRLATASKKLRRTLPTIDHEIDLVRKTKGTVHEYRAMPAEVLLLYASKSNPIFKTSVDALQEVLLELRP